MSAHVAWLLICRLFAGGTPVFRGALSAPELQACTALGSVIKSTVVSGSFALCPYCQLHSGRILLDRHRSWVCQCPDCGSIPLDAEDRAAILLNEEWFHRKLRRALDIESRDGVDDLGGGVWRLGDSRRSPVLLARDIVRLWREPALLDRVRVAGGDIRVITPKPRETRGAPFGAGVEWLALEDRFGFYGSGISFFGAPGEQSPVHAVDPAMPVHGPFSADFKWVTLPGWPGGPIRCTDGQAALFKSLWSFKGEPVTAERVMQRADLDSDKPIDVFKVKARDKGKPEAEGPLAAYRALVVTQKRQGLYSMPEAITPTTAPA